MFSKKLFSKTLAIFLFCLAFIGVGIFESQNVYAADADARSVSSGYKTTFWKGNSSFTCKSNTKNWNEFKRLCNSNVARQEGDYLVFYESETSSSSSTRYKVIGWNLNKTKSTSSLTTSYSKKAEYTEGAKKYCMYIYDLYGTGSSTLETRLKLSRTSTQTIYGAAIISLVPPKKTQPVYVVSSNAIKWNSSAYKSTKIGNVQYKNKYATTASTACKLANWSSATKSIFNDQKTMYYRTIKINPALSTPRATVTYNANGGKFKNGATSMKKNYSSTSFTLSCEIPVKSGWTFFGWSTTANSDISKSYNKNGSAYSKSGNVTMYAVWGKSSIQNYKFKDDVYSYSIRDVSPAYIKICKHSKTDDSVYSSTYSSSQIPTVPTFNIRSVSKKNDEYDSAYVIIGFSTKKNSNKVEYYCGKSYPSLLNKNVTLYPVVSPLMIMYPANNENVIEFKLVNTDMPSDKNKYYYLQIKNKKFTGWTKAKYYDNGVLKTSSQYQIVDVANYIYYSTNARTLSNGRGNCESFYSFKNEANKFIDTIKIKKNQKYYIKVIPYLELANGQNVKFKYKTPNAEAMTNGWIKYISS